MPQRHTLERFIARVEAIKEFYTEHAFMQENNAAPRVGGGVLVAHEAAAMARVFYDPKQFLPRPGAPAS